MLATVYVLGFRVDEILAFPLCHLEYNCQSASVNSAGASAFCKGFRPSTLPWRRFSRDRGLSAMHPCFQPRFGVELSRTLRFGEVRHCGNRLRALARGAMQASQVLKGKEHHWIFSTVRRGLPWSASWSASAWRCWRISATPATWRCARRASSATWPDP